MEGGSLPPAARARPVCARDASFRLTTAPRQKHPEDTGVADGRAHTPNTHTDITCTWSSPFVSTECQITGEIASLFETFWIFCCFCLLLFSQLGFCSLFPDVRVSRHPFFARDLRESGNRTRHTILCSTRRSLPTTGGKSLVTSWTDFPFPRRPQGPSLLFEEILRQFIAFPSKEVGGQV